jgi:hypothetical protein
VRERRAPFNPSEVVAEFVGTLRHYGITRVIGDRYAGEWPRERFREHDVTYQPAEKSKSEYYLELLPLLNSGTVRLLEQARLVAQLTCLERRTARGGRDTVDHPPGFHDDVVNAAAGALVEVRRASGWVVLPVDPNHGRDDKPLSAFDQQLQNAMPEMFVKPSGLTCGQCANRTLKNGGPYCGLRRFVIRDSDPECSEFLYVPA